MRAMHLVEIVRGMRMASRIQCKTSLLPCGQRLRSTAVDGGAEAPPARTRIDMLARPDGADDRGLRKAVVYEVVGWTGAILAADARLLILLNGTTECSLMRPRIGLHHAEDFYAGTACQVITLHAA